MVLRFEGVCEKERRLVHSAGKGAARDREDMMSLSLLGFARGWLLFLALFELPALYQHLWQGKRVRGFFGNLANGGPERRLWSMVLSLLVISRVVTFARPTSASFIHCGACHSAEAIFFGAESRLFGGKGGIGILAILVFNAFFFSYMGLIVD